jgi:hypothetical protein
MTEKLFSMAKNDEKTMQIEFCADGTSILA